MQARLKRTHKRTFRRRLINATMCTQDMKFETGAHPFNFFKMMSSPEADTSVIPIPALVASVWPQGAREDEEKCLDAFLGSGTCEANDDSAQRWVTSPPLLPPWAVYSRQCKATESKVPTTRPAPTPWTFLENSKHAPTTSLSHVLLGPPGEARRWKSGLGESSEPKACVFFLLSQSFRGHKASRKGAAH